MWKLCIPTVKAKQPQHFKRAKNTRSAVDVSYLLRAIMSKPKNSLLSYCTPPCVPADAMASLESNHDALTKHGIITLCFFDRFHHPMKDTTIAECAD